MVLREAEYASLSPCSVGSWSPGLKALGSLPVEFDGRRIVALWRAGCSQLYPLAQVVGDLQVHRLLRHCFLARLG